MALKSKTLAMFNAIDPVGRNSANIEIDDYLATSSQKYYCDYEFTQYNNEKRE